jgi:ElaA protein
VIAVPSPIIWRFERFLELTLHDLYALLQLRSEVFVVEQRCVFQDMDGSDDQAMHLLGKRDSRLLAYARCYPAGVKFKEASIGRIVTRPSVRGMKIGHHLLDEAVQRLCKEWGVQPIRIGAQAQLERFYQGHGFVTDSAVYVEDGIDHLEMLWKP